MKRPKASENVHYPGDFEEIYWPGYEKEANKYMDFQDQQLESLKKENEELKEIRKEDFKKIFDRHCRDRGITYSNHHLSIIDMTIEDLTQNDK